MSTRSRRFDGGSFLDSERNVPLCLLRIGHEGERGKLQGGQPFHQVACTRGYFNTGGYFNEEILFLACASLNTALLPEPITIALAPIYLPIIIARTYLSATGQ